MTNIFTLIQVHLEHHGVDICKSRLALGASSSVFVSPSSFRRKFCDLGALTVENNYFLASSFCLMLASFPLYYPEHLIFSFVCIFKLPFSLLWFDSKTRRKHQFV